MFIDKYIEQNYFLISSMSLESSHVSLEVCLMMLYVHCSNDYAIFQKLKALEQKYESNNSLLMGVIVTLEDSPLASS